MAKNRKTLKELQSLTVADIQKLTKKELQAYKKVARDEVARGVKRMSEWEYKPPAWYQLEHATGESMKISFKGKQTLQQQKKELAKAIHFLQDPTHLNPGWKAFKKKNIKALNKEIPKQRDEQGKYKGKFSDADFDRLYFAFDKAKQINKNVGLLKYEVMASAIDVVKNQKMSIDEIAAKMATDFEDIYKENEEAYQDSKSTRSQRMK